jgi:hypothetical protein
MAELTYQRYQMKSPQFGFIEEGNVAAERAASMSSIGKLWPHPLTVVSYTPPKMKL